MKDRINKLLNEYRSTVDSDQFNSVRLNQSLFDKMVEPVCFEQCAKTDVDIVFLNEMECTYK